MNRFLVTFDVSVEATRGDVGADRLEWFTDQALELLCDRSELIDPDAGAALAHGSVEFMAVVDAVTPEKAVSIVGNHLRVCLVEVLNGDGGADLRVKFRRASAEESTTVRAAS